MSESSEHHQLFCWHQHLGETCTTQKLDLDQTSKEYNKSEKLQVKETRMIKTLFLSQILDLFTLCDPVQMILRVFLTSDGV